MSFQRKHDTEPQASHMRALDTNHKPGHHIPGHGPLGHGREVVASHNAMPSAGHDGGAFAVTTDGKLTPTSEPNTGAGNKMAAGNAAVNKALAGGPRETSRPDQIVASVKTN